MKVEESRPASGERPSAGPVYRCIYAKDGLLDPPSGIESPWEFFWSVTLPFFALQSFQKAGEEWRLSLSLSLSLTTQTCGFVSCVHIHVSAFLLHVHHASWILPTFDMLDFSVRYLKFHSISDTKHF